MIPTALHDDPQKIIDTMYDVDRQWMKHHPGLGILLPDTYGTTYYLNNCPTDIIDGHSGMRFDSKDPMIGIPEYISFLQKHGKDPQKYIGIPSDGLQARTSVEIFNAFSDQMPLTFGNGTHLTNNTKGTRPRKSEEF
jgi:nicotinate phosphoribosyltransferase